ncbi:hypothetical protein [Pedobacter faecalis]|uniref:hypothetical protein n=1 Tax=Pedobacter faecalis TaxID=3041495 RepID=UPI00254AC27F|nr:hypothetical protein [Pedobacter sp. ELA7]
MLFINKDLPEIIGAREKHVKKVTCRIRKKLLAGGCDDDCDVCKIHCHKVKGITGRAIQLFTQGDTLTNIIGGLPAELLVESAYVWEQLVGNFSWEEYNAFLKCKNLRLPNADEQQLVNKYKDSYDLLERLFDYDTWFLNGKDEKRYDIYTLAQNLNRQTCTYCNRLYTYTIKTEKGEKIIRPTFDHWYSHSRHPLLALSFYNLIPSCTLCNSSIKRNSDFSTHSHLHPYLDQDCCDQIAFDYKLDKDSKSYNIRLVAKPGKDRAVRSYADMKLATIYAGHQSELADLIKIKDAYSEQYIFSLIQTYSKLGLAHQEVYRLAFGVEWDAEDFHKRPLSKFKKDILRKLEMI